MKKTTKKTTRKVAPRVKAETYVITRGTRSGVHAGVLVGEKRGRITLKNSRRLWYWDGAASLSEIAVYGCNPAKAHNCKFAAPVDLVHLQSSDVCEIIECRAEGRADIEKRPVWRA